MMNDRIMSLQEIKKEWHKLHDDPESRKNLRPEILNSWDRSYENKVPIFSKTYTNLSSKAEFANTLDESKHLIDCALPIMESLLTYLKNTGFVVSLTDSNLVMLKIIGDTTSMEWAKKVNLVEGSVWTEDLTGTNTGALALLLSKPISLSGYEHFCLSSIYSTASGCPIIDNNRVIGGIGMIAPYNKISNTHTLGMVTSTAKQIQSNMMSKRIYKYQRTILNSMSDGVMVIDSTGNITFINKKCAWMLGFQRNQVIGSNLHELFGDVADNSYFINTVTQDQIVTDKFFVITNGKLKIKCNITCTPINSSNKYDKGNVLIIRENERSNHFVKKWIGRNAKMTFDNIIGDNVEFSNIINTAKVASSSDSNVLILGESGTGKDIIAQSMHNASLRKNNPFVAVNCGSLPRELLASELFGYEEGAFTGAKKGGNIGKFELADQGTIFLDEIGDVPMDLQVMLLRVIEEKCILRLGGNKLTPVNVRIIAATNKNLEEEIARKSFRLDLFYRLGVIRLNIPPLRKRPDDILLLAEHFITSICKRYNKPLKLLSTEAKEAFINYSWPGNVRELQNVLEGAIQLTLNKEITYNDIANYLNYLKVDNSCNTTINKNPKTTTLHDLEKQMIEDYLNEGNLTKDEIAKKLGISRRTLYRRIEKYNII